MSYIEFIHVSKNFGVTQILKDFNLTIEKGEFVSLLGPSGCGKTTSLRILAGLEKNSSGELRLEGKVLSSPAAGIFVPPEKRNFGMVFQSYAVWPHMNVFENVAFPLRLKSMPKKEIEDEVMNILATVEMDQLRDRMPNQLSGGQQQRVALARGLVMKPKALLLDEPLSNLDTKLREKMRHDIKNLQKKFNITMIFVTHDHNEAKFLSDKIVILNKGVIETAGPFDQLDNLL